MKPIGFFLAPLAILAALGLPACASTPSGSASGPAGVESMSNVERYRKAVNANAERKNVIVQWVNPPKEQDLDEYVDEEDQE